MSELTLQNIERKYAEPGRKGFLPDNPGRPVGSVSLLSMLKAKLEECPENYDKKTYGQLIIERMLSNAIKEGNEQMIKLIWAYIEGMPKQEIKGQGFGGVTVINHQTKQIIFEDVRHDDAGEDQNIYAPQGADSSRI